MEHTFFFRQKNMFELAIIPLFPKALVYIRAIRKIREPGAILVQMVLPIVYVVVGLLLTGISDYDDAQVLLLLPRLLLLLLLPLLLVLLLLSLLLLLLLLLLMLLLLLLLLLLFLPFCERTLFLNRATPW